jgi:hypothetical protein
MFVIHCPICRKRVEFARREDAPFRPFCCERCKQVDLGRWLTEEYRVSNPLDPADNAGGAGDDRSDGKK